MPPTLLDLTSPGENLGSMHDAIFHSVLDGDGDEHRPASITGCHEGTDRRLATKAGSYIARPEDEPDELYHLADNPKQQRTLIGAHPEEAERLDFSEAPSVRAPPRACGRDPGEVRGRHRQPGGTGIRSRLSCPGRVRPTW